MPKFQPSERTLTPLAFYDRVQALAVGRCDWHSQRPEMRLLVTLTGAECARCMLAGVDLADVLRYATEDVARLTLCQIWHRVYLARARPRRATKNYQNWTRGKKR